jgi:hypothetical protein
VKGPSWPTLDTGSLYELTRAAPAGEVEEIPAASGRYVRWSPGNGLEVWLRFAGDGPPVGNGVHFRGAARFRATLLSRLSDPADDPLAGGFVARPDPRAGGPDPGPEFAFTCPDFRRHDELVLPIDVDLQLAGFVGGVELAPAGRVDALAASPRGTAASVTLGGRIVRADRRMGPLGIGPFWWVLVGTPGGAVDLVLEPGLLEEEPPRGASLRATCALSGLVHPVDRSRSRRPDEADRPATPDLTTRRVRAQARRRTGPNRHGREPG